MRHIGSENKNPKIFFVKIKILFFQLYLHRSLQSRRRRHRRTRWIWIWRIVNVGNGRAQLHRVGHGRVVRRGCGVRGRPPVGTHVSVSAHGLPEPGQGVVGRSVRVGGQAGHWIISGSARAAAHDGTSGASVSVFPAADVDRVSVVHDVVVEQGHCGVLLWPFEAWRSWRYLNILNLNKTEC